MPTSHRWTSKHAIKVTLHTLGDSSEATSWWCLSGKEDDADVPLHPEHQRGRSVVRNGQALHPGGSVCHSIN